jgi:hypothetical protein
MRPCGRCSEPRKGGVVSSPQNYPHLPPNIAREMAHQNQMMEGAAAARAAQQAGTGLLPTPVWRRKWIRGLIAVVVAAIALVELPVQIAERHEGPAIAAAVIFVLFTFSARRFLRRPR